MSIASSRDDDVLDVLVVGAGISGLSAARKLVSSRVCQIAVVEAKDRIGGRTETVRLEAKDGKAGVWDLGGQWVCRTQTDVLELLAEFGIETYKQHTDGINVLLLNVGDKFLFNGVTPPLPWLSLIDTENCIRKIDQAAATVPVDDPLKCRDAYDWDRMTLEDFFRLHIWTEPAAELHALVARLAMGTEPSRMSLLYYLHFCNAAGGLLKLAETTEGSAQEWKIKGSTASLVQCLVDAVGRDRVFCDLPVTHITQTDDVVTVQTLAGQTFRAKKIILAIPPQQISRITIDPPLPTRYQYLSQHMPVGHLSKFVATYTTPFWRNRGYSGNVSSSSALSDRVKQMAVAEGISLDGCITYSPVCCVWDATTHDGLPALVGLQGGKVATQWSCQPLEFHKKVILKELKYLLGDEADDPVDFALRDWSTVPWNGGCPISYLTPGAMTGFGGYKTLRKPWHHIHFAGTELATVWCGYMSGAVQSGHRAAAEVLHNLRPDQFPALGDSESSEEPKEGHKPKKQISLLYFLLVAGTLALGLYASQRFRSL